MKTSFEQIGVTESLVSGLKKMGITQPTEIQAKVIPLVLKGNDVIGHSPTGTGKTLTFLLPLVMNIDTTRRENQAIILTPTYELAMQIQREIEALAAHSLIPATAAAVIGEANISRQIEKLKTKPHIIVGSSGRILELIQKRKINAQTVKTLVIDEADRLLGEQQLDSVKAVLKTTLRDRQLLLFSATVKPATVELAKTLMREPVYIQAEYEARPDIAHWFFVAEMRDKIEILRKFVRSIEPAQALVFINRPENVAVTVAKLNYQGLAASGLHGSASKEERKKAMDDFRSGRVQLLVASDIAARGLDLPGVNYVINLDTPDDPYVYLHRVGRTGRAGRSGTGISIIAENEQGFIERCGKTLKIAFQAKVMLRGRAVDARRSTARPAAAVRPKI